MRGRLYSLAVIVALAWACSPRARFAGRYTHRSNPKEVLELRSDGTLVLQTEEGRVAGTYEVEGDRVTARPERRAPIQGTLRGVALECADGETWARKWPAGHYAHHLRGEFFVDLWPDGTFRYAVGDHDHRGHYDIKGATLTLWYPSDGRCTRGGSGPAVPSPGECSFLAEVRSDTLSLFRLAGETREPVEEFVLQQPAKQ